MKEEIWDAAHALLAALHKHRETLTPSEDLLLRATVAYAWKESVIVSSELPDPPKHPPTPAEIIAEAKRWATAYYARCNMAYDRESVSAQLIAHLEEWLKAGGWGWIDP